MLWTDFDRFGSFIDPWRSLERLNRVISGSPQAASTAEFPAINIWADGEAAVVTAELPGMDPKTVDISVMGKSVTLRASRNAEGTKDEESYHRQERWYGTISRNFELPYTIDSGKIEARFSRGVLHLSLPRAEQEKPRKIEIKTE